MSNKILKLFRCAMDMLFVLLLYVISTGVLSILIYISYNAGTLTSATSTSVNIFVYILTFVFGCKIVFIGYDTYMEK